MASERTAVDVAVDVGFLTGAATMLLGVGLKAHGRVAAADKITMAGTLVLGASILTSAWRRLEPSAAVLPDPATKDLAPVPSVPQPELAERQQFIRAHRTLWADPSWKRHFAEGDLPKYMPSPGTLPVFTQAAQEERYVKAWDFGPTAERVRIAVEHRENASPLHAASWAWSPTALAAIQTISRLMAEQAVRKSEDPAATQAELAAQFALVDVGSPPSVP